MVLKSPTDISTGCIGRNNIMKYKTEDESKSFDYWLVHFTQKYKTLHLLYYSHSNAEIINDTRRISHREAKPSEEHSYDVLSWFMLILQSMDMT
ncbi:hypothetical protein Bpfe_017229, partial [Biomphalaria pfeifferi]